MDSYIYLVLSAGVIAMLFSFWKTSWINKQDQGTERMEKIRKSIADGLTRLIDYGISDETAWQVGLACGGKCEVFIEPVE